MPGLSEILSLLQSKKAIPRLFAFTEILNEALLGQDPFFDGCSIDRNTDCFTKLLEHSENMWKQSVSLLREGSWATSVFLSIACIEEIGKMAVARVQVIMNELQRSESCHPSARTTRGRNPLLCHTKKHKLAAFSGFLVNTRADRILGPDNILRLLELAENGSLETIRQNSLYSSGVNGLIRLPEQRRSKEDAIFFATAAGELLCEIGGVPPSEFERLLSEVTAFETEFSIEGYRVTMTA